MGLVAQLISTVVALATAVVLGPGALAPADAYCLERVELTRLRHNWGLARLGRPEAVRIAVEDCRYLGYEGLALVEGVGSVPVVVVDCQQRAEMPRLSELGILADVQPGRGLDFREGTLILWQNEK